MRAIQHIELEWLARGMQGSWVGERIRSTNAIATRLDGLSMASLRKVVDFLTNQQPKADRQPVILG